MQATFQGTGQFFNSGPQSDPRALLSEQARAHIRKPILDKIINDLAASIGYTFTWALIPAVLVLAFVFLLTNDRLSGLEQSKKDLVTDP
jgi:hypothetical protein